MNRRAKEMFWGIAVWLVPLGGYLAYELWSGPPARSPRERLQVQIAALYAAERKERADLQRFAGECTGDATEFGRDSSAYTTCVQEYIRLRRIASSNIADYRERAYQLRIKLEAMP